LAEGDIEAAQQDAGNLTNVVEHSERGDTNPGSQACVASLRKGALVALLPAAEGVEPSYVWRGAEVSDQQERPIERQPDPEPTPEPEPILPVPELGGVR